MIWLTAIELTLLLALTATLISFILGTMTAVMAWWSNKTWAIYTPLLMLSIPPWLFTYYIGEFGYFDPFLGASLSLGICCSVYPHAIITASLAGRAFKNWEMLVVINGKNLTTLFRSIWPSIKMSLLPSIAVVSAEVIADFGVANYYGLNTVTMLSYNVWTSTWNLSQIWWGLSVLAILGFLISQLNSVRMFALQRDNTNHCSLVWGLLATLPTVIVIIFGISMSVYWILLGTDTYMESFLPSLYNTLYLTISVVMVCIVTSLLYFTGYAKTVLEKTGLGLYALPGTVLGAIMLYAFGSWVSLYFLLVIAVSLRYYGLMINTISVADRGNQKYFEVINFYSHNAYRSMLLKIQLVLPSVIMGTCLVVLDVIRELPISMILQPMNFQTLAMRMNYIARMESIPNLGPQSLTILMIGLMFSVIIIKLIYDADKNHVGYHKPKMHNTHIK